MTLTPTEIAAGLAADDHRWPRRPRQRIRLTVEGSEITSLDQLAEIVGSVPSVYWCGRPQPTAFIQNLTLRTVIQGLKLRHFKYANRAAEQEVAR